MKKVFRLNKKYISFVLTLIMFSTLMGNVVFAYVPSPGGSGTTPKMQTLTYQLNESGVITTTITDVYIKDETIGIKYADSISQSIGVSNAMYALGLVCTFAKISPVYATLSFIAGAAVQSDLNSRDTLCKKIKATVYASSIRAVRIRYTNIHNNYGYSTSTIAVSSWNGSSYPSAYTLGSNKLMPLTSFSSSN